MQATAIAQPNIALIKYWGKRDATRNLPAVGSISITLSELYTRVCVELVEDLAGDLLQVNGIDNQTMLPRISACLDNVISQKRPRARVSSSSNFPIAAGLASSASAFAATTVAAAAAGKRALEEMALAELAGRASGSAARSIYGGFVELSNVGNTIKLDVLADENDWPLRVVVAITESGPKATGSTDAMQISRETSPFYEKWIAQQSADLDIARRAISERDFAELADISEHNCLKMHSVMWSSRPSMVYWNSATLSCMQTIRQLRDDGHNVFFTIDAGPQVKAVCLPADEAIVTAALASTPGVEKIMTSGLGGGARIEAPA